jgi:transmembrane sensor
MDSARLTYLFHRYLNETCTDAERDEFFQMIATKDYEVQVKNLMNDLWNKEGIERKLSPEKSETIFQNVISNHTRVTSSTARPFYSNWFKLAAVIFVFALALGVGGFYFLSETNVVPKTASAPESSSPHQIIKLPDGTVVKLNSESSLQYPETFDDKSTREVTLIGEGYFDVVHDPLKAFIVRAGSINTVVLGTAFNIKAYENDEDITVTVTRGKVRVSEADRVLGVLNPDQQITFTKDRGATPIQQTDSKQSIAWAEQDLFFDDITFEAATQQLEKQFGVTITFTNEKLKSCRFTATFIQRENLHQMLTVICEFNGAQFQELGNTTIEISGDGCQSL